MVVASSSLIQAEFGGFPFMDTAFDSRRLLAAVACGRWARAHGLDSAPTSEQLAAVLEPANARRIRRLDLQLDLPSEALPEERILKVRETLTLARELLPAWGALLSIPIEFRRLVHSAAISASIFAWPQSIFLADRAFASDSTLAEQLVHEMSHQWLYFLEEIWPLQIAGSGQSFTLPSGTAGRSASELLGALHVVANLRTLWRVVPVTDEERGRRLEHLHHYGAACLRLLDAARPALTVEGQALAQRLYEEVRSS